MGLPENIAVKLNAYTLFGRQLLAHLTALNDATRTDPRLTARDCFRRFDDSLHLLFSEASPTTLEQATDQLCAVLEGRVALLQNPRAAAVFDQVMEAARDAAPTWDYWNDLEAFHRQGRELARYFYAPSPWPATQARLNRQARLLFCADVAQADSLLVAPEKPSSYHPTPVSFRQWYLDEETDQELEDVILVRFGFGHDFGLYLAYPYLFMHEYVAHIFALDSGNERFNDGWLLHAADAFLAHRGWDLGLVREQIDAFHEHLYDGLNPIPRQSYCFARDFDYWLNEPQRFQAMTWELAAFEPQAGESPFWPDQVINRLEQEFDHDRPRLRQKIQAARDLRALFEMLAPV